MRRGETVLDPMSFFEQATLAPSLIPKKTRRAGAKPHIVQILYAGAMVRPASLSSRSSPEQTATFAVLGCEMVPKELGQWVI
jgi:hypothetical protein